MNAKERRLKESGRDRIRYVYLIDEWPEGRDLEHIDAFLQAPEVAVIKAIARDKEHYGHLLQDERTRRIAVEAELERLRQAIALVLGVAARDRKSVV